MSLMKVFNKAMYDTINSLTENIQTKIFLCSVYAIHLHEVNTYKLEVSQI